MVSRLMLNLRGKRIDERVHIGSPQHTTSVHDNFVESRVVEGRRSFVQATTDILGGDLGARWEEADATACGDHSQCQTTETTDPPAYCSEAC